MRYGVLIAFLFALYGRLLCSLCGLWLQGLSGFLQALFFVCMMLFLVFGIANIAYAITQARFAQYEDNLFSAMIQTGFRFKIAVIPYFLIYIPCWLIATDKMRYLLPEFPISSYVLLFLFLYLPIAASSAYMIASIVLSYQKGNLSHGKAVWHIVWQFIPIFDVLDTLILHHHFLSKSSFISFSSHNK